MNSRLETLRAAMRGQALDAFLVTSATGRRYLSGFSGSAGALLVTPEQSFLITDFRYYEQAAQQAPAWTLHRAPAAFKDALVALLETVAPHRLGFEADVMTVAEWRALEQAEIEGVEWVATEGVLRRARTAAETLPGFDVELWLGVMTPTGTSRP